MLCGFVARARALTGHQHRDWGPDHSGPYAMFETINKHVARALRGFLSVDMRSGPVGGKHVQMINNAAAQAAMKVKTGRDQAIWPDSFSGCCDPVSVSIEFALDRHGAVHDQVQAVQWKHLFYPLEEFALEFVVSMGLNCTARHGLRQKHRLKWVRILLKLAEEWHFR